MYEIIYYQTPRGEEVVKEFLHGLDDTVQAKVYARLTLLQEEGPNLKRPYADIVQDKIRELRVQFGRNQVRILYFFFHKDRIILLDGFRKKGWAIHPADLERAKRRMEDWIARHP